MNAFCWHRVEAPVCMGLVVLGHFIASDVGALLGAAVAVSMVAVGIYLERA